MEQKTIGSLSKFIRIGGYFVAGGALVGFSIGVYMLVDRFLFSSFISISQFEVMSYFLGVFMPSFAILVITGYLFATTSELKNADLLNVVPLSILGLLCLVLSALSAFYFISFVGGFLALTALLKAYAKPAFKALSRREAFFFVEIGAILVASFSVLFLLMWLSSNFFQTYAMGLYRGYSPYALLWVVVISFLMFFAIPLLGSQGTNAGLCAAIGLVMSALSFLIIVQNSYVFFNASAYIGVFMLILGFVSALAGDLVYLRVFFRELGEPTTIQTPSLLFYGRYCPYCGKPRSTQFRIWCSYCGRSSMWTPDAPFCSSCGRLVPKNAQKCPHCEEDISNKRIYFQMKDAKERSIANKLTKSRKKKLK